MHDVDTRGCFADGGNFCCIPVDRLYQTGLNILNMFPLLNVTANLARRSTTRSRDHLRTCWRINSRCVSTTSWANARRSFKYTGWSQREQTVNGSIPGFNDTRMQNPVVSTTAVTINYNLNPTMFLEGTYGRSGNEQADAPSPAEARTSVRARFR